MDCWQVVRVTKAAEVQMDFQVATVSVETTVPLVDQVAQDGMVPRDSSDRRGWMACLECRASRDTEV